MTELKPEDFKGMCPVCSKKLDVVDGNAFCGDHYMIDVKIFDAAWKKWKDEQGSADELMKTLLDSNIAENKTTWNLLKAHIEREVEREVEVDYRKKLEDLENKPFWGKK